MNLLKRYNMRASQLKQPITALLGAVIVGIIGMVILMHSHATTPEQARPVADFLNSFGTVVHMDEYGSAYGDPDATVAKLKELGIRQVRTGITAGALPNSREVLAIKKLAAAGIKFNFVINGGINKIPGFLATIKANVLSSTLSIEGENEIDTNFAAGTSWAVEGRAEQRELYAQVRADPAFNTVKVSTPSLLNFRLLSKPGKPGDAEILGDLSKVSDIGTLHVYFGGDTPENDSDLGVSRTELARWVSKSHPQMVSETGYHNATRAAVPQYTGTHKGTSEAATAIYVPRIYFKNFSLGLYRTFTYQLIDTDRYYIGCNNAALSPAARAEYCRLLHEDHFGLAPLKPATGTWGNKRQGTAVKNLTTILADSGSMSPGSLNYTLNDMTADHVLLQKSDGSFWLALWREQSIWDVTNQTDIADAPKPLTVTLNQAVCSAEKFVPNDTTVASPVSLSGSSVKTATVSVGAKITLLHIKPKPAGTSCPGGTDTQKPTVSITAPANNTSLAAGTELAVTAQSSDNVGVTKVELYVDGGLKTTTTTPPASFTTSLSTVGLALGKHAVQAKAYDTANVQVSASITFVLTPSKPGDCSGTVAGKADGRVNAADLSLTLSHYGQAYDGCNFDGSSDGLIGATDVQTVKNRWTW